MTTETKELGLVISRRYSGGTEYVSARVVARDQDNDTHPRGVGSFRWELPKHLQKFELDNLGIDGFVSDVNDCRYIGYGVEYRNVYSVDQSDAERMLATMRHVNNRLRKDNASEPGDVLASFAAALKLDFVCEQNSSNPGDRWSDNNYHFMTIGEGRNRFRQLVKDAEDATRERHPGLKLIAKS